MKVFAKTTGEAGEERRGGALRTLGAFTLTAGSSSLVLGIYLFRHTLGQPTGDQSAALIVAPFWRVASHRRSICCDPCQKALD